MSDKLIKLLELVDKLNCRQENIYAEIKYSSNCEKVLEIAIRSKKDYSYLEKCEFRVSLNSVFQWNNILSLFENYIGGLDNE